MVCRILGFAVAMLFSSPALADQISTPPIQAVEMQSAFDLQAAIDPSIYQGVQRESVGAVYFPDTVLTYELPLKSVHIDEVVQQWSKSYRFIVVPFTISVHPQGDREPEVVDVTMALNNIGKPTQQPIVYDLFPTSRFKTSSLSGSVGLKINLKAKFETVRQIDGGGVLYGGLDYSYASAYADVLSGKGSGHAFWKFSRTQDSYPAGDIPLKIVLAVPKTYQENALVATFDVHIKFPNLILFDDFVIARFESLLQLPQWAEEK